MARTKSKPAPPKAKPAKKTETQKAKAKSPAPKPPENPGLTIDFQKRHITFGANLVPTKIKLEEERFLPKYANEYAACADLYAKIVKGSEGAVYSEEHKTYVIQLPYRTVMKIETGFAMQLPPGWKAEVSQRSGWGKKGLIVTNSPGQIDEDYRGPLCVLVANVGKEILTIKDGDRIGQMRPAPVFRFDWEVVDALDETERGEGGFGSTGGM